VRIRRHQRVAASLGLARQDANECGYGRLDMRDAALQVQAKIERDLFVARPAGVQSPSGVADARDELSFDKRMDVLVGLRRIRVEEKRIARGLRDDLLEGLRNP
jgi:hypothetical protein